MKINYNKKILSLIMMLAIISSSFTFTLFPQKANADDVIVEDFITEEATVFQEVYDKAIEYASKALKIAAKALVQEMVQSIVAWINSGFQGNPSFITDPAGFLKNTADQTIGEFIFNDPSLNFLCSPFQIKVKLALGLEYRPFYKKINCTLSGVLSNIKNSFDSFANGNFIDNGGWDTWFNLSTNPQNTPQGSYLMAKEQLGIKIQGNKIKKNKLL